MKVERKSTTRWIASTAMVGFVLLAVSGKSEAGIIYSGLVNQSVGPGDTYSPIIEGTLGEFSIEYGNGTIGNKYLRMVCVKGSTIPSGLDIKRLTFGESIDSSITSNGDTKEFSSSEWPWDTPGYVGFNFRIENNSAGGAPAGTKVYGWMQIEKTSSALIVSDWAYEDTGAGIAAGSVIPEPSSIVLLVIGALGMKRVRRYIKP